MEPRKARQLDPLAGEVLHALSARPEATEIVLGGYFALQHYMAYRETHDVDAWWRTRASRKAETAIREVMHYVAATQGFDVRERRFGETLSFELIREGKKHFSFQIATRSVELEPPVQSPWPPIMIESLRDNVGAKMNALVDRGAPRDFTDIKQIVNAGLCSAAECWELWSRKNSGQPVIQAKEKVLHHLSALCSRRPLESIDDQNERARAGETREWYRTEFLVVESP